MCRFELPQANRTRVGEISTRIHREFLGGPRKNAHEASSMHNFGRGVNVTGTFHLADYAGVYIAGKSQP